MPGYLTHTAVGLLVGGGGAAAAAALDLAPATPEALVPLAAITVLAAIFPDVDTPSKARMLFSILLLAAIIGLMAAEEYKWAALAGIAGLLPGLGKHRGWTHQWWAALIVPAALCLPPILFFEIEPEVLALPLTFGVLGYGSHLVMDKMG